MENLFRRKGYYIFCWSRTLNSVFYKRNYCTLAEGYMGRNSALPPVGDDAVDTSNWKKVNANVVGIKGSMISASSWTVMRILKNKGFDAYLVGGCVRDLILQRVPKDFDVITTANLKEIRKQFNRALIVGKRFPICHVWIKGSITEVSSFDTVAQRGEKDLETGKGKDSVTEKTLPETPFGCNEKDINLWRNSMQRDFTINSLFFDPFDFTVYDYTNGIEDIKTLKLRTVIPAQLSFEEDCARILRGLRIAARLCLSFLNDIETAIPKFVSSIASLDPFRLTMEMNYMLSYGAAGPSILLLKKFNLLQHLLPFQAAYLEQACKSYPLSSTMLVRLFSNMDKLVFCDQPADCKLWISLLAFHTALVRYPQDALVVSAFGSVLYHGSWKKAVRFAREQVKSVAKFAPEISESSENKSDEDLAEAVAQFTFLLQDSVNVLTRMEDLQEALSLFPYSNHTRRVFISERKGREVKRAFDELVDCVGLYESKREGFIDYLSLKKGDLSEIRFVLGKIIIDTMTESVIKETDLVGKKNATKTQKVRMETDGNGNSACSSPAKNLNQSRVQKHMGHELDASVWEPKQKTWMKQRTYDSNSKIQHVSAATKDDDNSLVNNHHQSRVEKGTKQGLKAAIPKTNLKISNKRIEIQQVSMSTEVKDHHQSRAEKGIKQGSEAAIPNRKLKILKRAKQEESKIKQEALASPINDLSKVASDESLGKLLHKLSEPIDVESSSKAKKRKSDLSEKTEGADVKLSSLFRW